MEGTWECAGAEATRFVILGVGEDGGMQYAAFGGFMDPVKMLS